MADWTFDRVGAIAAGAVAALSVMYAIAYLGVTPSAQRGADIDQFFRSYVAHPAGLRAASACLLVSGLISGAAVVAVAGRLSRRVDHRRALQWATIVGVVSGLATAAHGLSDLVGVDKLAHRYVSGDASAKAAVAVAHVVPSAVDPRGLATFGAAGLVALVLGLALRPERPRLGTLGVVLGADMLLLFVADAASIDSLVLLTGGLASVILGPAWWLGIAGVLWRRDEPVAAANPGVLSALSGA